MRTAPPMLWLFLATSSAGCRLEPYRWGVTHEGVERVGESLHFTVWLDWLDNARVAPEDLHILVDSEAAQPSDLSPVCFRPLGEEEPCSDDTDNEGWTFELELLESGVLELRLSAGNTSEVYDESLTILGAW